MRASIYWTISRRTLAGRSIPLMGRCRDRTCTREAKATRPLYTREHRVFPWSPAPPDRRSTQLAAWLRSRWEEK
jgi:hypothetical protein